MIGVLGAGAFGSALAAVWAEAGRDVRLWGRRMPRDADLPARLELSDDLGAMDCDILIAAVPMQALGGVLSALAHPPKYLVAACKGVDLQTLTGPIGMIQATCPNAVPAILSGPSFAADIRRGLPTALSLGCANEAAGQRLQNALSTAHLRLYRTTDTTGVELGGALKNVIAIACGAAIGAGLGESARAALMTRGFAEIARLATALGARPETLTGLSGFGDLALTCTSDLSRNFQFGRSLGDPKLPAPASTIEGRATARAVMDLAARHGVDMPVTSAVAALVSGAASVEDAMAMLLNRSLKEE